jgi:hypothetical protein
MLDWWLGREGIQYFREQHLREVIRKHIESEEADVDLLEGLGALNFLAFDDLAVAQEGEPADPKSVVSLPFDNGKPVFPPIARSAADPFLKKIEESDKKWVIITDLKGKPHLVLDSDAFLRDALFESGPFDPSVYCHRPIIVSDMATPLGDVVAQLRVQPEHPEDDVVDLDIILVWGEDKRVITGADILGRLLQGIVRRDSDKIKE